MLRDFALYNFRPHSFQRFEGPSFVRAHQAAVANDVGGKDGTQATFHIGAKQGILSFTVIACITGTERAQRDQTQTAPSGRKKCERSMT